MNETYCIVTDLFGASPFNAAMQVCAKETGFVVTGVNLALLLELLTLPASKMTQERLKTLIEQAQDQIRCYDPAALMKSSDSV